MNAEIVVLANADYIEWVALLIAGISFLFSVYATCRSYKVNRRLLKIEEGRHERETQLSQKAILSASLCPSRKHMRDLVITNVGSSTARDIMIELDGKPIREYSGIQEGCSMPDVIQPRGEFKIEVAVGKMGEVPQRVRLTWQDDSHERGKYESHL